MTTAYDPTSLKLRWVIVSKKKVLQYGIRQVYTNNWDWFDVPTITLPAPEAKETKK